MKSNIFVPKKINVGFVNREDTYTKKLAYIIYEDEKGTLRKETSWNGWRDKSIPNEEFENVPTSGFVLNKKAGDYGTGWNHRQGKIRVYDPRDFEFEITIENLLYILENATSTKGKGLEGNFIYGWEGKDIVLIPTESPDYIEIEQFNNIVHNNQQIKVKDLIVGATYKTNQNEEYIYMGKYNYHGWRSNGKPQFWFYDNDENSRYSNFVQLKSIGKKLISVLDSNCCSNYAELFDEMETKTEYSPINTSKDEYIPYTLEYFKEQINKKILEQDYWWSKLNVYCNLINNEKTQITIERRDRDESNVLKAFKKSKKMEKYKTYWSSNQEYEREVEYEETLIE